MKRLSHSPIPGLGPKHNPQQYKQRSEYFLYKYVTYQRLTPSYTETVQQQTKHMLQ